MNSHGWKGPVGGVDAWGVQRGKRLIGGQGHLFTVQLQPREARWERAPNIVRSPDFSKRNLKPTFVM